jgi:hypothetical protein
MSICKAQQTYNSEAERIKFYRDISPKSFWCHVCRCTQHGRCRHCHGVTVLSQMYQPEVTQLKNSCTQYHYCTYLINST